MGKAIYFPSFGTESTDHIAHSVDSRSCPPKTLKPYRLEVSLDKGKKIPLNEVYYLCLDHLLICQETRKR